jgi:hypothetical protein
MLSVGCSKNDPDEIVIDVPENFSGQVHIEMGVAGAPALKRDAKIYRIAIPPDGKAITSTMIAGAKPKFGNLGAGQVWGYTPSISKTGDGIPVGATIEFFVGTKEQYESAEAKKHKSRLYPDTGPERPDRS